MGTPGSLGRPNSGAPSVSDATAVAGQPGDRRPEAPSQGCPSPGASQKHLVRVAVFGLREQPNRHRTGTDFVKDLAARARVGTAGGLMNGNCRPH